MDIDYEISMKNMLIDMVKSLSEEQVRYVLQWIKDNYSDDSDSGEE